MRLILVRLSSISDRQVLAEFTDRQTGETVEAEFHVESRSGMVVVTGSEPDVLQWCEGSADDVRGVHKAVQAFAEAAGLSGPVV